VPRKRDLRQLAALAAAVTIAVELTATHWFYFYLVWFAPLTLAVVFGAYGRPYDQAPGKSLGGVPEWLNGAVSKTVVRLTAYRGFESLPLRSTGRKPAD
jgi:hypothetical protein